MSCPACLRAGFNGFERDDYMRDNLAHGQLQTRKAHQETYVFQCLLRGQGREDSSIVTRTAKTHRDI